MSNTACDPRQTVCVSPCTKVAHLVKAYRFVSIMFMNVILVGALALAILSFFLPADDLIWTATNSRRYSTLINREAYYLVAHQDLDFIGHEYDDLAESGHWQVNPWTGLISRNFKGRFLNIDQYGRRQTIRTSGSTSRPPLIIWAFGGSTTFGWGLPDQYTLPSALQVELQNRVPDRTIQCVNFASPWYNSSHESALFIANLRMQKVRPHIAFFLDGYNDLMHIVYYQSESPLLSELSTAWEARILSFRTPPPWITLSPTFPPFRLASKLGWTKQCDPAYRPSETSPERAKELLSTAISNYRFNHRMIEAIGKECGVATYLFLQPVPYWTDKDRITINQPDFRAFEEDFNTQNNGDLTFNLTVHNEWT